MQGGENTAVSWNTVPPANAPPNRFKIGNRILFPLKSFEEWISQKEQLNAVN